jgi:phosphatidylethanolamine-binding protein (PEBP) family uncharacterized protein
VLAAAALAGCGSSSHDPPKAQAGQASRPGSTADVAATESTKLPSITMEVGLGTKLNPIPSRYACDGADVSPPIHWSKAPSGTAELAVTVLNFAPVKGKLFADWAIAGLKPNVTSLSAGKIPAGTTVGRNGFGQTRYAICPPKGATTTFLVRVYALKEKLSVKPGFDAASFNQAASHSAPFAGEASFTYKRR